MSKNYEIDFYLTKIFKCIHKLNLILFNLINDKIYLKRKRKHDFFHENLEYIPCQHVPMQ